MDRHLLSLPPDLAPGRYRLEMGLYSPDDPGNILSTTTGGDRVVLDYLPTVNMPASAPNVPLDADFDGRIRLLGYTLDCNSEGSGCNVRLYWQAMTDQDVNYTVFVHLVGQDGQVVSQHDGMPDGGFYPTSAWEPGEVVVDEHQIDLPEDMPPGDYRLLVGLYRLETDERLPLLGPNGELLSDSVLLTTMTVPAGE